MDAEEIAAGRARWQQRYDASRKADRDFTTLSGDERVMWIIWTWVVVMMVRGFRRFRVRPSVAA